MTDLIYLAGPINGHTPAGAGIWRLHAAELLELYGLGTLDPMRGKAFDSKKEITPAMTRSGLNWISRDQVIVERDLRDLDKCSGVLVNVGYEKGTSPKPLTGTVCEVFAAKFLCRPAKPCVAFVRAGDVLHPQFQSPWFGQFFTPQYKYWVGMIEAANFLVEVL